MMGEVPPLPFTQECTDILTDSSVQSRYVETCLRSRLFACKSFPIYLKKSGQELHLRSSCASEKRSCTKKTLKI